MFINFLIVIFIVFIVYLLFSTSTFQEGMKKKKGGKKLKIGKKGGLKMRAKKAKKKVVDAVDGEDEEGEGEGEGDGEDAVNDAGTPLPKMAQLPRMVDDLQTQMRDVRTQVDSLLAEKPTISASALEDEPDDGVLEME
jgi:hypothetical protein